MNTMITFEEYLKKAKLLANGSDYLYIITFGIFLTNEMKSIITVKRKDTRIIVSSFFKECTPNCPHCRSVNNSIKQRLNNYSSIENTSFKFITECHAKLFLTNKGMLIGGMNFSHSNWSDFVIFIDNKSKDYKYMVIYFNDLWQTKSDIDITCTNEIVLTFGKYKGLPVKEVIQKDKQYIDYLTREIPTFKEQYLTNI